MRVFEQREDQSYRGFPSHHLSCHPDVVRQRVQESHLISGLKPCQQLVIANLNLVIHTCACYHIEMEGGGVLSAPVHGNSVPNRIAIDGVFVVDGQIKVCADFWGDEQIGDELLPVLEV